MSEPTTQANKQRLQRLIARMAKTCGHNALRHPMCAVCQGAALLETAAAEDARLEAQVAALTAQLAEAQRERDEAVSAKDFHAARAQRLQDAVIAAQSETAALREALADVAERLDHMIRYRHSEAHNGDVFVGGLFDDCPMCEETRDSIAKAHAALGGQPPTGGQTT